MRPPNPIWTDENIAYLKANWSTTSSLDIARHLGPKITRGMVISKAAFFKLPRKMAAIKQDKSRLFARPRGSMTKAMRIALRQLSDGKWADMSDESIVTIISLCRRGFIEMHADVNGVKCRLTAGAEAAKPEIWT